MHGTIKHVELEIEVLVQGYGRVQLHITLDVSFLRFHSNKGLKAALASVSDHPLFAGKDMHVSETAALLSWKTSNP